VTTYTTTTSTLISAATENTNASIEATDRTEPTNPHVRGGERRPLVGARFPRGNHRWAAPVQPDILLVPTHPVGMRYPRLTAEERAQRTLVIPAEGSTATSHPPVGARFPRR
jgi:hypothetical protein